MLDALWVGIMRKKVNWILDADVRGFFDNLSHEWLVKFIERRIADRRILRLIQKWLRAGVSEEGKWSETEVGTPQGAVASPLLANIYLHYAFDLWVKHWRKHHATGDVIVVNYADDCAPRAQRAEEGPMCVTAGSMREGPRNRLTGAGSKPPSAATVKSRGREHWKEKAWEEPGQVTGKKRTARNH